MNPLPSTTRLNVALPTPPRFGIHVVITGAGTSTDPLPPPVAGRAAPRWSTGAAPIDVFNAWLTGSGSLKTGGPPLLATDPNRKIAMLGASTVAVWSHVVSSVKLLPPETIKPGAWACAVRHLARSDASSLANVLSGIAAGVYAAIASPTFSQSPVFGSRPIVLEGIFEVILLTIRVNVAWCVATEPLAAPSRRPAEPAPRLDNDPA